MVRAPVGTSQTEGECPVSMNGLDEMAVTVAETA
jgi:hypothetical protein